MSIAQALHNKITAALQPIRLSINDDSHRHEGHAGARPGGETHFQAVIVSAAFAGKSRVERQRMVYGLLDDEFKSGLHALQLRTLAPDEDR